MKQEEIMKTLITELFKTEELHQEYQDNDIHFAVDVLKEGDNTLFIKVQLLEDEDKKEFEQYVDAMPDSLFEETWEKLSETDSLHNLSEIYNTSDYKVVIDKFMETSKQIAQERIQELQKFI